MVSFDPYHVWLGIPPEQQPPDHYRLLGIELFESDNDVISNAAERQMAHIRGVAVGPRGSDAQRLLNEISRARHCLLDAEQRADYDAKLRQQLEQMRKNTAPPVPPASSVPQAIPAASAGATESRHDDESASLATTRNPSAVATSTRSRQRRRPNAGVELAKVIAGGLAGIAAAILLLQFAFGVDLLGAFGSGEGGEPSVTSAQANSGKHTSVAASSSNNGDSPDASSRTTQTGDSRLGDDSNSENPDETTVGPADRPPANFVSPDERKSRAGAVHTESSSPSAVSEAASPVGAQAPASPAASSPGEQPTTTEQRQRSNDSSQGQRPNESSSQLNPTPEKQKGSPGRSPVPVGKAREQALEHVKEVFREEYDQARTAQDTLQLAQELAKTAARTEDDLAAKYVLYEEASLKAIAVGDAQLALQAVNQLDDIFAIDALAIKATLLVEAAQAEKTAAPEEEAYESLVRASLPVMAEAVAANRFDLAERIGEAVLQKSREPGNGRQTARIQSRLEEIEALQAEWEEVQSHWQRLEQGIDDSEANLRVGLYLCVGKNQWAEGLSMLAQSSDARLKESAKRDLADPTEASAQLETADAWWDAATAQTDDRVRDALRRRSYVWYKRAVMRLSGLTRARVEKRLDEVHESIMATERAGPVRKFRGHQTFIQSLAFSPNGRLAASGGTDEDCTVRIWSVETGEELHRFSEHTGKRVDDVIFSPNGRYVVSAGTDANIFVWDIETGTKVRAITGHAKTVRTVAISPNGKLLASGSYDRTSRLWDFDTGQQLHLMRQGDVRDVLFSPDGDSLLTCGSDKLIHEWDVDSGREIRCFSGADEGLLAAAISPDGRRIASGSGAGKIQLWDARTKRAILQLPELESWIAHLEFTPDGKRLLTLEGDRLLRLWDFARQRVVFESENSGPCCLSPCGRRLLIGRGDYLELIRLPR